MRVRVVSVGKFKSDALRMQELDLLKRLRRASFKVEQVELAGVASAQGDIEMTRKKEAELILKQLGSGELLVALDEVGKQMNSPTFANWLQGKMNAGQKGIVFVLGGAYGLHHSVRDSADLVWSLSLLTFPYQMARLILIEQLYRASSLLNGSPYHKE